MIKVGEFKKLKEEDKQKKYFLKRYRNYLTRIERLEEKISSINEELIGIKSITISDMPKGGQPITKDDLLIRREETEQRIQTLNETSLKVKKEIYECIDHLDDFRLAEVLENYFIDAMTLEEIAEVNHYSIRHVGFLYAKGIESIQI